MAGIVESGPHARDRLEGPMIFVSNKMLNGGSGIGSGIDRFDGRLMVFRGVLVEVLRIAFLNVRRVAQHDRGEITRGRSAVDVTIEAGLGQYRQHPRMI